MSEYIIYVKDIDKLADSCMECVHVMEEIVRCGDCIHCVRPGTKMNAANAAIHTSCLLHSYWDSEYDYMDWRETDLYNHCSWGEKR